MYVQAGKAVLGGIASGYPLYGPLAPLQPATHTFQLIMILPWQRPHALTNE